jgi:hypothetical protein
VISLSDFFEPSISRPPTERERQVLSLRLSRLTAMQQSAADATTKLRELVDRRVSPDGDLRIRHGFIRLHSADSSADTSSRKGTERHQRPPSTRILSPRGLALSFSLTTLLDAQMRLSPGQIAPRNERPIKAENEKDGWTNYVATDAQDADKGRVFKTVRTKKVRQIQSGLIRLADQNLIHLPRDGDQWDYDAFAMLREDARATGDNDLYKVPDVEDEYFTVPLSLFTNGWIYVLEDSELVLLLIAARMRAQHGDKPVPMRSGPRKLNYGLTKDSYESAHRILDYLDILDVISDFNRSEDGKVDGIAKRGAQPHRLRFRPEALERPAYPTIVETITEQIAKSESA